MSEPSNEQLPDYVSEIIETEQKRAKKLVKDAVFRKWAADFRQKYIVDGFVIPFYSRDGRYARSQQRVSKFGNYIMPWEK